MLSYLSRLTVIKLNSVLAGSRARTRQRSHTGKIIIFVSKIAFNWIIGSEAQLDIQSKLTVVWDCLLLSATSRIAFMRKYSLMNYCRNMCKAVDMWAETTVFLLALVNLLAIEKKIKVYSLNYHVHIH